jgi:hypothetical protein
MSISGVSTRLAERPEGKRLFDVLRQATRARRHGEVPRHTLPCASKIG